MLKLAYDLCKVINRANRILSFRNPLVGRFVGGMKGACVEAASCGHHEQAVTAVLVGFMTPQRSWISR